ncbi:hypothetical protein LIER_30622 [Lithospermum erythrorhizon]|uniref:Uncharacterized protein n=1 Tax=Lithospermum erythrorhizon TaxID=34254 RepID=A0AAV3RRM2_LITER
MGSLSIVAIGDKAYTERRVYLLLAFDVSPPPAIPPEMVSTLPVILSDVSIFPPCLGLRFGLGRGVVAIPGTVLNRSLDPMCVSGNDGSPQTASIDVLGFLRVPRGVGPDLLLCAHLHEWTSEESEVLRRWSSRGSC